MIRKTSIAILLASLLLVPGASAKKKEYAHLKFTVQRSESGKPVRNASVILHPLDKKGKQEKGGLQLKTDAEGRIAIEGIPYGKMRIQVISSGFQTYGEDHDIDQPVEEI